MSSYIILDDKVAYSTIVCVDLTIIYIYITLVFYESFFFLPSSVNILFFFFSFFQLASHIMVWIQVTREGECCPECSAGARLESSCILHGLSHRPGEQWQLDKCTTCVCHSGTVSCHTPPCEYLNKPCPPGWKVRLRCVVL